MDVELASVGLDDVAERALVASAGRVDQFLMWPDGPGGRGRHVAQRTRGPRGARTQTSSGRGPRDEFGRERWLHLSDASRRP
jgi:hypothetical protein